MTTLPIAVVIDGTYMQGLPLAASQSFSQFLAFGDSNIDSGYFFTHSISTNPALETQYQASAAVGGGLPTTPGGLMNSTLLANYYGLSAIPVGETGGTNYAASGAATNATLPASLAPTIVSQIQSYLAANNNHADPNALYLISGGGNDLKIAEMQSSDPDQQAAYMITAANALAQEIEQLYAAGARYIVSNGNTGAGTPGEDYIITLWNDLSAAGVPFFAQEQGRKMLKYIDADPAEFGLTNIVAAPVGPFDSSNVYSAANGGATINPIPADIPKSWALYATGLVSADAAQTYLWADDEHLSAAGQQIEADYMESLIQSAVPTVGESLKASSYISGVSTPTPSFQWQSEAAGQSGWSDIAGATHGAYTVQQSDLGNELRVVITYQGETAASNPTEAVAAAQSAGSYTACVALASFEQQLLSGPVAIADKAAQIALNLNLLGPMLAAGDISSITLTDGGIPNLAITEAQWAADGNVLADIPANHTVSVQFSGAASQYAISSANGAVSVSGNGVSDSLTDVAAIQFSDVSEIIAATPGPASAVTTGNVTELYAAVLAREPDIGGLAFYQNYLKSNPAIPLQQFADYFLSSAEYTSKHSYAQSSAGDSQFIEDSYQNLLHRTPSADEVTFYLTNVMDKAEANLTPGSAAFASAQFQAHALMLVYFSASAEFLADVEVTAANPASAQHWLILV